jgi:arginase family enzyme
MSGAYLHQGFYKQDMVFDEKEEKGEGQDDIKSEGVMLRFHEVKCCDIPGTNGYCDEEAKEELRQRLSEFSYEGIHFLDSGDYHYLSLLWMEKIQQPFSLVVFDHHPDMQAPSFGEITSCGGWVREALEKLPYLQQVYLVGTDARLVHEVMQQPDMKEYFYPIGRARVHKGLDRLKSETNPLYLSFDKDVLGEEDCICDWDQGEMTLEEAEILLQTLAAGHTILGMDVCGEDSNWEALDGGSLRRTCDVNQRTNEKLLEWFAGV